MKTGYLKFILRTFSLLSVIPAVNLYAVAPGQEEAKKEEAKKEDIVPNKGNKRAKKDD